MLGLITNSMTCTRQLVKRFVAERMAQDLVEYALLAALIGIAGTAAAPTLEALMGSAYQSWDLQNMNLWVTPEPQ